MGKIIKNSWALFTGFGIIIISHGFQGNLLGIRSVLENFNYIATGTMLSGYFVGYFIGAYIVPNLVSKVGHIRVFAAFASMASLSSLIHVVFVDPIVWTLARFLTGYKIIDSSINYMSGKGVNTFDTAVISLKFSDGSIASINYLANGHKSIAKERIEIFSQGKVIQLDNFRKLTAYGFKGFNKMKTIKQNKGQQECVQMFLDSIHDQKNLISLDELSEVAKVSLELQKKCGL